MPNSPTIANALHALIDARLVDTHIAMPGYVTAYDSSEQRASIQPILRREITTEEGFLEAEALPIIQGVPVIFLGAGAHKFTYPLSPGDVVWLMFSESSMDKWLVTGSRDLNPDDQRRNNLSDAVAIPGLLPFSKPSDQVRDGATVISAPDIRLGSKDASQLVALKSDMDALKAVFDIHTHPDPASGFSGPPTSPAPSPVGSTKVRVE